uniref:Reverse transcriptase domain-containing protein n=1 Tax=Sparus aurata TaxID=8175 RepID=A0A671TWB6_SPAAU
MVFLCVYAPVLSTNRMTFLNVLCDVIGGVSDEYLFLGGDFNCTADAALDRNHLGQRKVIHCLRSDNGSSLTEAAEIRRHATHFYKELFKTELVEDLELESAFLADLPQVRESSDSLLSADLTLDELRVALMSLDNGKAPGIDGIPVDFYKTFWPVVGEDMLEVFQESFRSGLLPQSCRRAVITLLPKKGDLQDLKNWRPVSLLCRDYKVLSKALALRLREAMAEVVHVDQTYCVPGRLISDDITVIRHVLDISSSLGIETALISIDQEKAFDRVEHQYLWKTLAAFGFNPGFIARIQVLYCNVASILKINGSLAAPFAVQRGVRQGCSLSGMLYSLAIEPFLHKLRKELSGVCFPGCPTAVKLSAYADDIMVVLNTQVDIKVIEGNVELFNKLSSSKVNWNKSEAFATTKDSLNGLVLPGRLS